MVPTMRVGVHQRKNGDVQRIPKLSHHQPAVDIWHTFPLLDTGQKQISFINSELIWIMCTQKKAFENAL